MAPTTLAFTVAPVELGCGVASTVSPSTTSTGRELDLAAVVDAEALDLELLTLLDPYCLPPVWMTAYMARETPRKRRSEPVEC